MKSKYKLVATDNLYNKQCNILFLCWDNATYSPVAESLMKRWSDDQFIVSSAGINPAFQMDPFVFRILKKKGLSYPNHAPQILEYSYSHFEYIFLLDERIHQDSLELVSKSYPVILDWRLPAIIRDNEHHWNERKSWQEVNEYYSILEHRIRLLTCTLFAGLEKKIICERMIEIAQLNNSVKNLQSRNEMGFWWKSGDEYISVYYMKPNSYEGGLSTSRQVKNSCFEVPR